jgi:hypothetical protein
VVSPIDQKPHAEELPAAHLEAGPKRHARRASGAQLEKEYAGNEKGSTKETLDENLSEQVGAGEWNENNGKRKNEENNGERSRQELY